MKVNRIGILRNKLLTVLPVFPHPGFDPYTIEREIHKDGKKYTDAQYGSAVAQLLREKFIEENQGLFRKTDRPA